MYFRHLLLANVCYTGKKFGYLPSRYVIKNIELVLLQCNTIHYPHLPRHVKRFLFKGKNLLIAKFCSDWRVRRYTLCKKYVMQPEVDPLLESISPTFYERICANIVAQIISLTFTASTKKLSTKLSYEKIDCRFRQYFRATVFIRNIRCFFSK